MKVCPLDGCEQTAPHGHGTDWVYGSVKVQGSGQARVEVSPEGLRAYDEGGDLRYFIEASHEPRRGTLDHLLREAFRGGMRSQALWAVSGLYGADQAFDDAYDRWRERCLPMPDRDSIRFTGRNTTEVKDWVDSDPGCDSESQTWFVHNPAPDETWRYIRRASLVPAEEWTDDVVAAVFDCRGGWRPVRAGDTIERQGSGYGVRRGDLPS